MRPLIKGSSQPLSASASCLGCASRKRAYKRRGCSQILSKQHSGFSVWLGDAFQDQDSSHFVARYIERGPISLEKLSLEQEIVTYTTKDDTAQEFNGLEFLALLSTHVAKPYESLTRYFGYYSCRTRGERKKLLLPPPSVEPLDPHSKASSSWAACMKRILEVNPLECPSCKSEMRIIAFIHDTAEISKIMRPLNIPDFQPPPKLPRVPPQTSGPAHTEYDF